MSASQNPVPQARLSDLSRSIPAADTAACDYIRASLDADRAKGRRWTDPLTPDERATLAAMLDDAAGRYALKDRDGSFVPARVAAVAELVGLRAEVRGEDRRAA